MTEELFRNDGYLQTCDSKVTAVETDLVCLDQTIFYPVGGGQPGDTGTITRANGEALSVIDTFKDRETGMHWHKLEEGSPLPEVGEQVNCRIDWDRRYRLMKMHSCMHMLCALIPAPVTGGSIRDGSARLDFDIPDPLDKVALEEKLNEIIAAGHDMEIKWITDQEMSENPDLVRTMSVKPPMGSGKVRLIRFGEVDLQPCGGTHVANSSEIGPVVIQSIKKKGKQNRRITIEFAS